MSKKKQDILHTAESLFYRQGFHAVGIKQIINDANVSLMTLYNHFDSKESLILEILNHREQAYFSYLKNHISNERTSITALEIVNAHFDWLEENDSNGCFFLRAKEEFKNEFVSIADRVDLHKSNFLDFLSDQGFSKNESFQLALQLEGATALSETLDNQLVKDTVLFTINAIFKAD